MPTGDGCPAVAKITTDGGKGHAEIMALIGCGRADDGHTHHAAIITNSDPTVTVTWETPDS